MKNTCKFLLATSNSFSAFWCSSSVLSKENVKPLLTTEREIEFKGKDRNGMDILESHEYLLNGQSKLC